jgi:hypothetical protein
MPVLRSVKNFDAPDPVQCGFASLGIMCTRSNSKLCDGAGSIDRALDHEVAKTPRGRAPEAALCVNETDTLSAN